MKIMNFNQKLSCIGFLISSTDPRPSGPRQSVDIERTLLEAMLASAHDGRLASLVFSWLKVHGNYVNVERLGKLAGACDEKTNPDMSLLSGFAAFACEHCSPKWKKLIRRSRKPVYLYPKEITDSAVSLRGSIDYLKKFNFIVPKDSIRIREEDVLSPGKLIKAHLQYRNRYLYGPSWRADIITAIESGAQSPADIARTIGCSYEPAHRVWREYRLAKGDGKRAA